MFEQGYLSNSTTVTFESCPPPQKGKLEHVRVSWRYVDSVGTSHAYPGFTGLDSGCGSSDYIDMISECAPDGSGYALTVRSESGTQLVTDRTGRNIVPPVNSGSGAATVTDANGNQITGNSSGQYFDTLSSSTPVLTVAGSGTPSSPLTYSYTAPAGNFSYKVNYVQYTVQTAFGFSSGSPIIQEYGPV